MNTQAGATLKTDHFDLHFLRLARDRNGPQPLVYEDWIVTFIDADGVVHSEAVDRDALETFVNVVAYTLDVEHLGRK